MTRLRAAALGLAVPTLAAGALAAPADARVVVGKGMAGVAVGDSAQTVRDRLGAPTEIRRSSDDFGAVTRWYFASRKVHVTLRDGGDGLVVFALLTRRGAERTASGVGVGSTVSTLRRRVKGVTCERFDGSARLFCSVGEFLAGRVVTTFRVSTKGKVAEVSVGRVVD